MRLLTYLSGRVPFTGAVMVISLRLLTYILQFVTGSASVADDIFCGGVQFRLVGDANIVDVPIESFCITLAL